MKTLLSEANSAYVQGSSKGVADASQRPREGRVTQRLPDLLGKAQEACRSLDSSLTVKVEILNVEVAVTLELWHQRFRQFTYHEAEGP